MSAFCRGVSRALELQGHVWLGSAGLAWDVMSRLGGMLDMLHL